MKVWAGLALMMSADVIGNLCITRGMKQVGAVVSWHPEVLLDAARRALRRPMLGAGILCFTVAFFTFLALLSWADLSFVLPVTAISYVANTLGARWVLHERVTGARWMGTVCIAFGVALISLGGHG